MSGYRLFFVCFFCLGFFYLLKASIPTSPYICAVVQKQVTLGKYKGMKKGNATIKTFEDKTLFSCNVYVVNSEKGVVVIDPGYYGDDLKQWLHSLGHVDAILLTHGHCDHIRGLEPLKSDFPNAKIYASRKESALLKDPNFVLGINLGVPDLVVKDDVIPLDEGNYKIVGYDVKPLYTPGHTLGGMSFIFPDENAMFCGDALLHYAKVPLNRPTGSPVDFEHTLKRFATLDVPDGMVVYPGHRESATIEQMRRDSPDMKEYYNTHKQVTNMKMTDYEAIQNLVVGERLYRSTNRNDELANCYSEDAHIHTSWQSGGRDTFVGKTSVENSESLPLVNRCNPPLIHFPKNNKESITRAVVEYPTITTRVLRVHGEEAVLSSYMRLLYRVEKRHGEWKIVNMYGINEFDTLEPAIPGVVLKIAPDDVKDLRKSYRWLSYTRQLAGGTISQDLVGSDRPEGVKSLFDEAYKWMEEE